MGGIGIQGVWFNWYCAQQRAKGLPVLAQLSDIARADMKAAKHKLQMAQSRFQNMPVTVRRTSYTSKDGEIVAWFGQLFSSFPLFVSLFCLANRYV